MKIDGPYARALLLAVILLASAVQGNTGDTSAVSTAKDKNWSTVRSPDRNFVVMDMPSSDALSVMIWADSVNQLISDWAQSPVPGKFVYPLMISAVIQEDEKQGRALKFQVYSDDGHLRQKMTMVNPSAMDQEDAVEALCHLLLNRWIHSRPRKAGNLEQHAEYPEWFAVGVAQNIYPELSDRNYKVIRKNEMNGMYKPASDIFSFTHAAPGRWPEKAHAGLVMSWMAERVGPQKLMDATANQLARREVVDEGFILMLMDFKSRRDMNVAWDLWMARQDRRITPGMISSDTDSIIRVLEMRSSDFGLVHPNLPPGGRVPPGVLIKARYEPWAKEFCRTVLWRLHQESIGKTPEVRKHVASFANFYDEIIKAQERTSGKKKTKNISTRSLEKIWRKASREWTAFLEMEADRQAYLNRYIDEQSKEPETATKTLQQMMIQWENVNP